MAAHWKKISKRTTKNTVEKDCGGSRGCGTDSPTPARPPAQIRFDIKPKDPPTYHGKATEDIEVWSQQVDNYLQLLGGDDQMQVAYVGTLLQGAAQLWFQRENNAGRRPRNWTQLAESLCNRFGNTTKADYAQSQLSSMRQGKNESAHDYSLRFEAVLDKIPAYEESWVRNIFVWGLHSSIAQEVNMKNPKTLNRAMELAKRADVAITMARRPSQRDAGSQEQRKPAAGQQHEQQRKKGYWQNRKQNKNWRSGNAGTSGGQAQHAGQYQRGNQPVNPQQRGGRSHPAPTRPAGPGPRNTGAGNQHRTRFATMHPQEPEDMAGEAGQQDQEAVQQTAR